MPEFDGAKVREVREALGYSGREFAAIIGISQGHLWKIEQGLRATPKMVKLIQIAMRKLTTQRIDQLETMYSLLWGSDGP